MYNAFPVSQPAISRHLRGRLYRLRPGSLDPLAGWLDEVRRFWADHLEQFRSFVEQETAARPEEGP